MTTSAEIIYVDSHRVGCNGGGGPLGHPLTYFELGATGQAVCGYCGRTFVHKDHAEGYEDPSPRVEAH